MLLLFLPMSALPLPAPGLFYFLQTPFLPAVVVEQLTLWAFSAFPQLQAQKKVFLSLAAARMLSLRPSAVLPSPVAFLLSPLPAAPALPFYRQQVVS